MSEHPPWCSPQDCFLDEDGVQVHKQQPVRWEQCEVRFESRLLLPDGEHPPTTYLQLRIDSLRLTWRFVEIFLPITAARRLCDQLTAHLNAAHNCPSTQAQTIHSDLTPRLRLWEAFADHDLLVVPSTILEAFGLVTIEAQARGLPVAYQPVPGLREVLAGSALPLDFADPTALAAELDWLRTDTTALTELRTAGLDNAARYPLSQTVRRLADLSDQIT